MASNSSYSEIPECPLCLEPLGLDDINFYPCSCRYQICRFCWHRIRTDENGLCPHCREMYSENPAEYTPPTADQLAKLKSDRKQKEQFKRQKVVENREKLASVRVIQRNLVFVIGLSSRLADSEILKKNEFFGKYGKIYKVVINNHTIYNGAQGPSVSAYVTYCRNEDASKAIAAVNNVFIDGRSLKASFGTTKYCTSFLKGTLCTKPDCMYLHELGEDEASFTKEDMQLGKHQVFEHATLTSLLTGGGGGSGGGTKDHTPFLVAEGGMKIKHSGTQRSREPGISDAMESALPSTAHWAQKVHSGPDTTSLDMAHSQSKQSDSVATAKSGKEVDANTDVHSLQSCGPITKHLPSGCTSSKKVPTLQDGVVWDEALKSVSRPESLSPTVQGVNQSRNLELSPRSTLSASSSLDSLGGGLDGVNVTDSGAPAPVLSASSLWKESSLESSEVRSGETSRRNNEIWEEDSLSNWSSGVEIRKSEDEGLTVTKRTMTFPGIALTGGNDLERGSGHFAPPLALHGSSQHTFSPSLSVTRRQDEENSKQAICSPPGLSKMKQPSIVESEQTLPLSKLSGEVLELEEETSVLYLGNNPNRAEHRHDFARQERGDIRSRDISDDGDSMRPLCSGKNGSCGTGTGRSSAMGTNWSFHYPHNPPTHSNLTSQYTLKQSQNPHPTSNPFMPPNHASSSTILPSATFSPHTSLDRVDDADELGFDPCVISQQGLADLLETEAEQQQQQQNVSFPYLAPAHGLERAFSHSHPTSSAIKRGHPNGIISSLSEHSGSSFYGKWQGVSHPASASSVSVDCVTLPSSNDSLRDEFRALFPNVNISFGGSSSKIKLDKPSSLVQALDDSNPSMSSFLFPSSSTTNLHSCPSSSTHHPHPSTNKQEHYPPISSPHLGASNSFLGRSQPGFPSSCLRVPGHDDGIALSSSIGTHDTPAYNSSSSCLGPEWPGLGIAVAKLNMGQSKSASLMTGESLNQSSPLTMGAGGNRDQLVPLMSGIGGSRTRSSSLVTGAGGSRTQLASVMTGAGVNTSQSSPLLTGAGVNGSASNIRNSWMAPAAISVSVTSTGSSVSTMASLPSPPPGFSKTTPITSHTRVDGTGAAAGLGTPTTTNATPMLLMNIKGQVVSNNHLLQAWNNMRSLASLSPAQQQQLARNNQLTYQQLLAQQYLFQQAMLRNPQALLQAQSIRMAQLQQQAMQHQQQQKVLTASVGASTGSGFSTVSSTVSLSAQAMQQQVLSAAVGASTGSGFSTVSSTVSLSAQAMQQQVLAAAVGASTGSGFNTVFSAGPVSAQSTSKLLMSMAGGSFSATSGSLPAMTATATSGTQSGKLMGAQSIVGGAGCSGNSLISRSKPHQNVASNGVEGQCLQTDAMMVSVQTSGGSKGIGDSTASEVMNGPAGQQNSSSKMGEVRHSRNKTSAKSKTGLGTYNSSSLAGSDKKSRLKSSK